MPGGVQVVDPGVIPELVGSTAKKLRPSGHHCSQLPLLVLTRLCDLDGLLHESIMAPHYFLELEFEGVLTRPHITSLLALRKQPREITRGDIEVDTVIVEQPDACFAVDKVHKL